MAIFEIRFLATLGLAMALASCATPKAEVVAEAPATAPKEEPVAEADVPEPALPSMPNEEIRVPPMLNLPTEAQFRASNPLLPKPGSGSGGVIVRPPTEPPSRVKPDEKPVD